MSPNTTNASPNGDPTSSRCAWCHHLLVENQPVCPECGLDRNLATDRSSRRRDSNHRDRFFATTCIFLFVIVCTAIWLEAGVRLVGGGGWKSSRRDEIVWLMCAIAVLFLVASFVMWMCSSRGYSTAGKMAFALAFVVVTVVAVGSSCFMALILDGS